MSVPMYARMFGIILLMTNASRGDDVHPATSQTNDRACKQTSPQSVEQGTMRPLSEDRTNASPGDSIRHGLFDSILVSLDIKLVPVDKSYPHYQQITAFLSKMKQSYARSKRVGVNVRLPLEFTAPGISKVFPDHDFFLVQWEERSKDPKNPVYGLFAFAHLSIGISKKGEVTQFGLSRSREEFGKFLQKNRVKISNIKDAQNVLEAFCAIHRIDWKARPVEKVSDTVWRLGVHKYKAHRGSQSVSATKYLEVTLNEDHSVQSAKTKVEIEK